MVKLRVAAAIASAPVPARTTAISRTMNVDEPSLGFFKNHLQEISSV